MSNKKGVFHELILHDLIRLDECVFRKMMSDEKELINGEQEGW